MGREWGGRGEGGREGGKGEGGGLCLLMYLRPGIIKERVFQKTLKYSYYQDCLKEICSAAFKTARTKFALITVKGG